MSAAGQSMPTFGHEKPRSASSPRVPPACEPPNFAVRIRRILLGQPRDLADRAIFHRISLVAFLAWVGLGADGLSSSSYGPQEAFHALGQHRYLAVGLAVLMIVTITVIASAYTRIISAFPSGGGGYPVATKLLGRRAGVVSGCALLVDYIMTVSVSIAAAGDALFSFLPGEWQSAKLGCEAFLILLLIGLNLRGIRESVIALMPIFIVFVITHLFLIGGGVAFRWAELPAASRALQNDYQAGLQALGGGGMLLLFLHAYSLGGGTYTGIEAVSNSLPVMREPRIRTARHTMVYMAASLAFTASGLIICYLLWDVPLVAGKTINAVLSERFASHLGLGMWFVVLVLLSEGALLLVGAQVGIIDGPRVLANMAADSWFPRRFAALSERLAMQNGIVLIGLAALAALLYTGGKISHLVVLYSINVFLTFSLSMLSMLRDSWRRGRRRELPRWRRKTALFVVGFLLCAVILVITSIEKFHEGGWLTIVVTGSLILLAFAIQRHYRRVGAELSRLYAQLDAVPPSHPIVDRELDPAEPTAIILVGGYGGLGIHTLLNAIRLFPQHFKNIVFVSAGVIDTGAFKGAEAIHELREQTETMLGRYVRLASGMGLPAASRYSIGTDVVDELESLCLQASRDFPRSIFLAGKIMFERERWYQRLLHNETAFAVQKRLQWAGKTMVIIPARVTE